jgi:DDE_Tnp_1-associated/Transposase DDE domain
MGAYAPGSLLAHLAQIPDPRGRHGQRFPLTALLAAACAAILCGARSFAAIAQWARSQDLGLMHRLGFPRTPPTSGAYRYLFLHLRAEDLEAALGCWIAPLVRPEADRLRPTPMDGKTARGSHGALHAAVHLLSFLDGPTGGVLRQTAVDAETNEHKAAPALLEGLVLGGRLVTADAMFCHRDVAERVLERGGHYFFAVKDNQGTLLRDIQAAFEPAFSPLRGDAAARRGRHGEHHRPARGAGRGADDPDDDAAE